MSQISSALNKLYNKHRIVFWYDNKRELREEFDAVALAGVEKVEIERNAFALKHRILREQPKQKFLLYHSGPAPDNLDNWLLDVQLAQTVFTADQVALWLSELGLDLVEFGTTAREHEAFLRAGERREKLAALLPLIGRYPHHELRLKMIAVCANSDPQLDMILESLLDELAQGRDARSKLIERCNLDSFLWQQVERKYGYKSQTPSVQDFAIALFAGCYELTLGQPLLADATDSNWNGDALIFLRRWKNSVPHREAFNAHSAQYVDSYQQPLETALQQHSIETLADFDLFELVDQRILSELVNAVATRTISAEQCGQLIRQRRTTHWFRKYADLYEATLAGARFMGVLESADLTVHSTSHAIEQYRTRWFQIDQLYRECIYHARRANQVTILAPLLTKVENLYSNQFLLPLNDAWQVHVDALDCWIDLPARSQRHFYADYVEPVLAENKKVFVIISDALRYEIADTLMTRIRQEDRYEAELDAAVTLLPSYTRLGMAALLPHKTLTFVKEKNQKVGVLADGSSTKGTAARAKLLSENANGSATAMVVADLLKLSKPDSRVLFREHDVIYVYQNLIDDTGDKPVSEGSVFDDVETALDELVSVIKKLANANASNFIVTADHGFIYQNHPLDESDFLGDVATGDEILMKNRRFVLGYTLDESAGFRKFSPADVGMDGSIEMLIPKSINRLRVKGAGSRYVHGGASLQEVIVPVLRINKARRSDTAQIDVDILQGSSSTITTGQFTVTFYQRDPVTAKRQPRILRVGLYTLSGKLISDQHTLTFDATSEHVRDREQRVRFVLTSAAEEANRQDVQLQLEERVGDTSHFKPYRAARYQLRRSFTSDFDF